MSSWEHGGHDHFLLPMHLAQITWARVLESVPPDHPLQQREGEAQEGQGLSQGPTGAEVGRSSQFTSPYEVFG